LHFSDLLRRGIQQARRELNFKKKNEEFEMHWTKIRPKVIVALKNESVPYHGVTYNHVCTMLRYEYETGDITLDDVYYLFLQYYKQYLPRENDSFIRGPTEEEIKKYPPGTKFNDTNSKP